MDEARGIRRSPLWGYGRILWILPWYHGFAYRVIERHRVVSMDPNRYEVSEPELLRGLNLSGRGGFLQDGP
jgi:hypothetical protein